MKLSKKILSIMMAVAIGVSSMSMLANAKEGEVRLCKTADDLKHNLFINEDVVLCNDIDMSGVNTDCLKNLRYTKTFDGKNHTIKNMTTPLAEFMNGATVRNVTLRKTRAEHGAVAEKIYDNTLIENVTVHGGKITGKDNLGAITGASRRSKIINCTNLYTEVRNAYNGAAGFEGNTGGIVGYMKDTEVDYCENSGKIYSENENEGGIVGKASNSTVKNCQNTGELYAKLYSQMTGGMVGLATYTKVKNCLNTGVVRGATFGSIHAKLYPLGGIVGRCGESKRDRDDYAEIQTCFNASKKGIDDDGAKCPFNPIYGQNWQNAKAYECAYLCKSEDTNADDDAPGKRFNQDKADEFVRYAHNEIEKLGAREHTHKYKVWSRDELLRCYR